MQAIWSGTVPSENRRDKVTGQPIAYRLVIFDTGEGTCSCPSFLYQSMNNPKISAADKLKFRCKHLVDAFNLHGPEKEAPSEPTPAPDQETATPPTMPTPPADPYGLWLDDSEPRTRR